MTKNESHLPAREVVAPPPELTSSGTDPGRRPHVALDRHDIWPAVITKLAGHIVRDIAPASSLDVGCGTGLLVEALVDRGVDACGVDTSGASIGQVRADLQARCRVGSALEPYGRHFDLITCIHVTEPLSTDSAEILVRNICAHTDDVVFAAEPPHHQDGTPQSVSPHEHWGGLFADLGFQRDFAYDLTYVAPWAMRLRRADTSVARVVREYERELSRLGVENTRLSAELSSNQRLLLAADAARTAGHRRAGKVVDVVRRALPVVAPAGSRRRRSLHVMALAAVVLRQQGPSGLRQAILERDRGPGDGIQVQYDEWRALHEPSPEELNHMQHENRRWAARPLVSIVMPTFNPQEDWLRPAVESVLAQIYENWELCIADDASTAAHVGEMLEQFARSDSRIKVVRRPTNGGIAAASASALELATGEFVALLDHDDILRRHALHRMVELLQSDPELDVIYSDEDVLLSNGTYGMPFFKPDWSPDLLLSVNYVCHFLMLRRTLVEHTGGFRPGFDGAQDHDLVLRATEKARHIGHVADVLYAWRQVPGSVALAADAKMYAYEAGQRAVQDALARRGLSGRVTRAGDLGRYHVRLDIVDNPAVTIVIPTRDRVELLRRCVESIESKSTYSNWSITIIDNDSVDPGTLAYLESSPHRVVRKPGHFNYSRLINEGRRHTDSPYILTLNNDVTVMTMDWIEALLEQAQRPEVGVVGGRLLYPDGRVQHEGIGLGNVRGGYIAANLDAWWMGRVIRDVSAVTGACQMVKTAVFDEVGGYDETLHVGFNDVDFCLRVRQAGYLIVYTPFAELIHPESSSRGRTLDPVADYEIFWNRWGVGGGIRDPYLSPHVRDLNPLQLRLHRIPIDR